MTIQSEQALDHMKAFIVKHDGAIWVDVLVETLGGQSVESVDRSIHRAADTLYAGLLETRYDNSLRSMVHNRILAKLAAQAAKPAPSARGRSRWKRRELS
jgi:hypothetical protein